MAVLGLTGGHAAAVNNPTVAHKVAAVRNGTDKKEIREEALGGFADGIRNAFARGYGCPPDAWGRSPQCRRMVRKNRMRKLGIKGSRI